MNLIQKLVRSIDQFQQRYRLTAFVYAVIKKYGEDQAGYQASLLTYYAFLSLFPLLLVLTTLTGVISHSHPALQMSIIHAVTNYFPSLGNQLSSHVTGIHKNGVALFIGILFTLYGARGVAEAFQNGVNHLWRVPRTDRDGFPKSLLKSFVIVLGGGVGLILASTCNGFATSAGHTILFRLVWLFINIVVLFALFCWLLNLSLPHHIKLKDIRSSAFTAAIGLVLLQIFGTVLMKRELHNLDAVYSTFATALGLLFWLYLQSQVLFYSVEIAAVHTKRLWPRSLDGNPLTAADKKALTQQPAEERVRQDEHIRTKFSA